MMSARFKLQAESGSPKGSHVCVPFESTFERDHAVVDFIHEGLSRGARCLFVGAENQFRSLLRDLEEWGICSTRAQARGALLHKSTEEVYLKNGALDFEGALHRYEGLIDDAVREGFTGLRTTGELSWMPPPAEWRSLMVYEARVNEYFARQPFSGLCCYPRAVVPADKVQDVLRTHPTVVVRGEHCDNPFYERAELALSNDSQARLDWQLRQLRVQHRARKHLEGKTVSAVTAATELSVALDQLRSAAPDIKKH